MARLARKRQVSFHFEGDPYTVWLTTPFINGMIVEVERGPKTVKVALFRNEGMIVATPSRLNDTSPAQATS